MAKNITKTKLADQIVEKTDVSKKDAKAVMESLLEVIAEDLQQEAEKPADERAKVQFIGFGSFEVRDRSARAGYNPQTQEKMQIPARTVPAFKASKSLKEQVNVK